MSDEPTANLKRWIEEEAAGEPIEAIVIGEADICHRLLKEIWGRVLSWEEAASHLDYDFDSGYGGAECHPIYAWTATKVIRVHEYDGSTSIGSVPRNPTPCKPEYG